MLDNSESGRSILPWEWQLVSPTRASIRTTDGFFSKQKLLEEVFQRRRSGKVRDRNILSVFREAHCIRGIFLLRSRHFFSFLFLKILLRHKGNQKYIPI